jgi:hypothetical protein
LEIKHILNWASLKLFSESRVQSDPTTTTPSKKNILAQVLKYEKGRKEFRDEEPVVD